jgi:hypothetical protein
MNNNELMQHSRQTPHCFEQNAKHLSNNKAECMKTAMQNEQCMNNSV